MIDVERLRRVALKRQEQGRVGMILTVRQVLRLIARGDAQQMAYRVRIEDLEAEVARLRGRAVPDNGTARRGPDELVRIGEAAEILELPVSTIGQMARRGVVYSERRAAVAADGSRRRMYFVDPAEVGAYAAMSNSEKRAVVRPPASGSRR